MPSHKSPPDAVGSVLGNTRLLAMCPSAALALSAGCSPDSPTEAGPDAQRDLPIQCGTDADIVDPLLCGTWRGHSEISRFTAGATQISGIGFFAGPAECNDPEGQGSDYDLIMTGDLEGCHYVFVETARCSPGGAYSERGAETFVGLYNGAPGTFRTTYLFTAKYRDCANLVGEIAGRCQHPLIAGSGEGVFEGVTGRIDMKDDVEAGNFPYRGHFRWTTSDWLASSSAASSSGTLAAPRSVPRC